ncbi:MAG: thioredoxin family protein [Sandaracinus sp.]
MLVARSLVIASLGVASLSVLACAPSEPRFRGTGHGRTDERAAAPTPAPRRPMAAEPSREGWNDAQIDWVSHEDAVARARRERRPVMVVMHADWCGHCRNYMHVFEDARIVERSQRMLMVRLDVDEEPEVAALYASDGTYVPRTYFVGPDGAVLDVGASNPRYRHFFDEHDPSSLLAGMDAALAQ